MWSVTWDVDPILALGPLVIRYYTVLFIGSFVGGYELFKWQVVRGRGDVNDAAAFILYGAFGVIVGARIGNLLFYEAEGLLADPVRVAKVWTGSLASHGAVVGLAIAMYVFCRRRQIPFLDGADRCAFSVALGATLVRVGNLMNSEVVGRVTDQSWGIRFPRHDHLAVPPLRHPSQLYEVALGLLLLGALFGLDRALGRERRPRGAITAAGFAIYFTGRFVIEYFKESEISSSSFMLTTGQILSIPGALIGYYGLWWSMSQRLAAGCARRCAHEAA